MLEEPFGEHRESSAMEESNELAEHKRSETTKTLNAPQQVADILVNWPLVEITLGPSKFVGVTLQIAADSSSSAALQSLLQGLGDLQQRMILITGDKFCEPDDQRNHLQIRISGLWNRMVALLHSLVACLGKTNHLFIESEFLTSTIANVKPYLQEISIILAEHSHPLQSLSKQLLVSLEAFKTNFRLDVDRVQVEALIEHEPQSLL